MLKSLILVFGTSTLFFNSAFAQRTYDEVVNELGPLVRISRLESSDGAFKISGRFESVERNERAVYIQLGEHGEFHIFGKNPAPCPTSTAKFNIKDMEITTGSAYNNGVGEGDYDLSYHRNVVVLACRIPGCIKIDAYRCTSKGVFRERSNALATHFSITQDTKEKARYIRDVFRDFKRMALGK